MDWKLYTGDTVICGDHCNLVKTVEICKHAVFKVTKLFFKSHQLNNLC